MSVCMTPPPHLLKISEPNEDFFIKLQIITLLLNFTNIHNSKLVVVTTFVVRAILALVNVEVQTFDVVIISSKICKFSQGHFCII
jgi:hypothetical protein